MLLIPKDSTGVGSLFTRQAAEIAHNKHAVPWLAGIHEIVVNNNVNNSWQQTWQQSMGEVATVHYFVTQK
jgi:hypothetical protein